MVGAADAGWGRLRFALRSPQTPTEVCLLSFSIAAGQRRLPSHPQDKLLEGGLFFSKQRPLKSLLFTVRILKRRIQRPLHLLTHFVFRNAFSTSDSLYDSLYLLFSPSIHCVSPLFWNGKSSRHDYSTNPAISTATGTNFLAAPRTMALMYRRRRGRECSSIRRSAGGSLSCWPSGR